MRHRSVFVLLLFSASLLAGCIGDGLPLGSNQSLEECTLSPSGFAVQPVSISDMQVVDGTLVFEIQNTQRQDLNITQVRVGNRTQQLSVGIGIAETTVVNATIRECRAHEVVIRYAGEDMEGAVNGSVVPDS